MNRRMILYMIGKIIMIEGALLTLPLCVSLLYKESCAASFLITIVLALVAGFILTRAVKPKKEVFYAKEGFVIVALGWVVMSAIGALPFTISGEIPNYVDAFFETVSGFTTTGASIVADVEAMSKGILFWRSFTHWVGGMGVLVFIMAVVPNTSDRSIHIMRAEMPGPVVGKLVPKASDTAKILYKIYIGITILEVLLLSLGGMPIFESFVHTFGTVGTGGLGVKADSIASYSPYLQWVITVFMLICGINFNLFYLLLIKRFKSVFRSEELWVYIGIVIAAIVAISINIYHMYGSLSEVIRQSAFQVASIITTTGYATTDFNLWPGFSKAILFVLMFIGGCAGSTAGGLKQSRLILLFKMIKREFRHMLHPRSVGVVKFEDKAVSDETINGVGIYLAIYCVCFFTIFLIVSLETLDFESNFSAVAACFNNIGPGFNIVGPAGNYAGYSILSKVVLSIAMLLGRLEIYPILFLLSPTTWSKNK
ncbi:MAG: TrkH family potassium uptake protein [Lachnospiraceae bacterium]|nr:TrkH family potassium uptake protein [Lachnospiraceae bacterium]